MRIWRDLAIASALALLGACALLPCPLFGQSEPGAASLDSQIVAHFKAAQEATQAGNTELAIREYQEVLRLQPGLLEARVNLGLDYFMAGQYQKAAVELEKARQAKPDLVPTNLFLGMAYQKLGSAARAIPPLEAVLRQDARNQEALRALAACYLDRGDYLAATRIDLQLFAGIRDPIEGWYALGRSYMAMANRLGEEDGKHFLGTPWEARLSGDVLAEDRKWVDAAAQYRRALALDAKIPGLHADLGKMLLRQGKLEDSEAEFRAELRNDPKKEEAHLGLAAVSLARQGGATALAEVAKVWEVFPPFLESQADFPPVKLGAADLAAVAQELTRAPDSPAREFLLAAIYRASGQNDQADRQWTQFLSKVDAWSAAQKSASGQTSQLAAACSTHRYTDCAKSLGPLKVRTAQQGIQLGKAQWALGDPKAAAAAFAESLNRDPANAETRYWLLRADQSLAVACLNHVVELAPDSWRVHQIQGEYAQSRFDYPRALAEFQAALRQHPDSAELHELTGNAFLLNKDAARGRAEIEKALAMDPTRTPSLYLLGRTYFQARDIPKSIEYFQAALRYDPRYLPARAALGRAYMRIGNPAGAIPELEKAVATDASGDLYYLLSMAYRQLGRAGEAAQAMAASQELRRKSAAHHEAGVAAAEGELADP